MLHPDILAAGGLATPFKSVPFSEALAVLGQNYGMSDLLSRLDTEKDDTFLVADPKGARFIAKFSNPDENQAEISLQISALDHVSRRDPDLLVPRVIRNRDNKDIFLYRDSHGQKRLVRALSYIEGTPLDRIAATAGEREKIGAVLARLQHAMADFSHPQDGRKIAWDVQHLLRLQYLLGDIRSPDRRALLEAGFDRFRRIKPTLEQCRRQVIHNDFSRSNLVADPASSEFISGVIDFGDVVRSYAVIDVSTALLNQLTGHDDDRIFDDCRDLLAGYLRRTCLTRTEMEILPHLVMARVIARALITTWRAGQFPDNAAYILRNSHQGWRQLEYFLRQPFDRISGVFADMVP
ncbi:phosphotransferase [Paracoccus methylarcula]|uniref:Hydroxylysine kinase n=1 Tax=Paracoccus methylarcula TaxID=72022 RepID=A0A3R7PQL8_9RHOB|nr:phosphotransferase [Paracoccus methylarcula]RNF35283.1 serine kinase [Paracoccus methylarcula]